MAADQAFLEITSLEGMLGRLERRMRDQSTGTRHAALDVRDPVPGMVRDWSSRHLSWEALEGAKPIAVNDTLKIANQRLRGSVGCVAGTLVEYRRFLGRLPASPMERLAGEYLFVATADVDGQVVGVGFRDDDLIEVEWA